jgi:outer membrane protein assembly factor BamB
MRTPNTVWAGDIGPAPGEIATATNHRLFATRFDDGIIEIDPATGAILSELVLPATTQQSVSDGLAFDGTNLYYLNGITEGDKLYRLDPATGAERDRYTLPSASAFRDGLACLNGLVYILDWSVLTQQLIAYDPDSGSIVQTLDIDATNLDPPPIKGGLAAISDPDALLVAAVPPSSGVPEILEIDPATGVITDRFEHGLAGVLGLAAVDGLIYVGQNTSDTIQIYSRSGELQGSITITDAIGFQSLAGDVPAPAEPPTISISLDGGNPLVSWTHLVANAEYEVWRDTVPDVTPGQGGAVLRESVTAAPWQYTATDAGAGTHYYTVVGKNGHSTSTPSNRVGVFRFAMVPGD